MKKITNLINISLLTFTALTSWSQQKDFEGKLEYTTQVTSKIEGISNKSLRNMIGQGEKTSSYIKQGNSLISSEVSTNWYIYKDKKNYILFKGIDTLYYQDFAADTTSIYKVSRPSEKKKILGYDCNAIILETKDLKRQYFYTPSLFRNPIYDQENKIDRFDLYSRETSSLWLSQKAESNIFDAYTECIKITPQPIDDSVFNLPELPITKFSAESLIKGPEFTKKGGWSKYVTDNINSQLAAKYVKLPKGQEMAQITVFVTFVVTEKGDVTKIAIENKGDAHKKLEEESIRIISESPKWKPATILGEKIPHYMRQPIIFAVTR